MTVQQLRKAIEELKNSFITQYEPSCALFIFNEDGLTTTEGLTVEDVEAYFIFIYLRKNFIRGLLVTIQRIRQDIAELKEAIKPEAPKALVIFLDENKNIVEIQGRDITGCTEAEINEILDSTSIHFYFPKPEEDPEE